MTTKVKICGITSLGDALRTIDAGADALGFNFWPGSKRFIEPAKAAEIIVRLPPFVTIVGLFVDQPLAQVRRTVALTGVHSVQLHGDEDEKFYKAVGRPVLKAVAVKSKASLRALRTPGVQGFVVDTPSTGRGGSGKTFDWSLLDGVSARVPLVLAGGLNALNVGDAIRQVKPWAVDVASGVERAPGQKDLKLVAQFIRAVRKSH